jgi:hypothetical protein
LSKIFPKILFLRLSVARAVPLKKGLFWRNVKLAKWRSTIPDISPLLLLAMVAAVPSTAASVTKLASKGAVQSTGKSWNKRSDWSKRIKFPPKYFPAKTFACQDISNQDVSYEKLLKLVENLGF